MSTLSLLNVDTEVDRGAPQTKRTIGRSRPPKWLSDRQHPSDVVTEMSGGLRASIDSNESFLWSALFYSDSRMTISQMVLCSIVLWMMV